MRTESNVLSGLPFSSPEAKTSVLSYDCDVAMRRMTFVSLILLNDQSGSKDAGTERKVAA